MDTCEVRLAQSHLHDLTLTSHPTVVGRIKDLIIRGGENLSPVAIENALCESHSIVEAAAVSVPDDVLGEVVGVWIVLHPGSPIPTKTEIANLVRARMNPQVS